MATTTNFGWETPDDTDLVKDGAAAMRTLGNSIDTSFVDLKGGSTGQVLSKASGTDLDFTWVAQDDSNAIQNAIVDAKGDIIAATAADTPARLAVGTNGQVLTADSSTATGLKWETPSAGGGGKVLQVVNATYNTAVSSSSATYAATGLTATITPTSSTSKILVLVNQNGLKKDATASNTFLQLRLKRGSTVISTFEDTATFTNSSLENRIGGSGLNYLDSPATTSATTYSTEFANGAGSGFVKVQEVAAMSTITLLEIGA